MKMKQKLMALTLSLAMVCGLLAPVTVSRAEAEPEEIYDAIPIALIQKTEELTAGAEAEFTLKVLNTADETLTMDGCWLQYCQDGQDDPVVEWKLTPDENNDWQTALSITKEDGTPVAVDEESGLTSEVFAPNDLKTYTFKVTLPTDYKTSDDTWFNIGVGLAGDGVWYCSNVNPSDSLFGIGDADDSKMAAGKPFEYKVTVYNLQDDAVTFRYAHSELELYAYKDYEENEDGYDPTQYSLGTISNSSFGQMMDEAGNVTDGWAVATEVNGCTLAPGQSTTFTVSGTLPREWNKESRITLCLGEEKFIYGWNEDGAIFDPNAEDAEEEGWMECFDFAWCGYGPVAEEHTHSYTTPVSTTKATLSKNGKIVKSCPGCSEHPKKTTTIYRPKTFKLSKTTFTYNGKVQKPKVTVKDAKGKTISSKNYTLTYSKGCKKVGTYKVKVKFKGNYSGTKTLTFKIKAKKK